MKTRKSIVLWTLCTSVIAFSILASAYRKSEESIAYNTLMQETYMIRPDSPLLGSPSAPVTIIEFFDPACKTCRRFYPFTQRILSDYSGKVRLFIKYLPVHGETSIEAIRILEAARNQGIYEAVLQKLMTSQSLWANPDAPSIEMAWKLSKEAGLDIQKAQNYIVSGKIDNLIKQDAMDRVAVDIHFAPTFYVNGRTLTSTNPYELLELVRNEVDNISSS